MPDLNPVSLWRRLLAAPNESRGKMLAMALLVSGLSAFAVSTAAVLLGPRLDANRSAERQARLDAMLTELPALAQLLAEAGADGLDILIADLTTGGASDIAPEGFDPDLLDDELRTALSDEQDIAGIGLRPDLAQIYVARDGSDIAAVILPVFGRGYQSEIRAFLALEGDLNTIAGLTITEQGETPGLGANIENASWQGQWSGLQLADDTGALRISVVKGGADPPFEVDAITGATRTSDGVENMIRFWVGPDGFGPVLDALRDGDL